MYQIYAKRLIKKRYSLEKMVKEGRKIMYNTIKFLEILPEELSELIKKTKQGDLQIDFEHKGLDKLVREMDEASDDISYSLIVAALIIGSSLVMGVDKGPVMFGYPILGLLGYLAAFIASMVVILRLLVKR